MPKPLSPEVLQKAKGMLENGAPLWQVQSELGISRSSIAKYFPQHQLPKLTSWAYPELRDWALTHGLTSREMAEKIGLPEGTWAGRITGRAPFTEEDVAQIKRVTGITLECMIRPKTKQSKRVFKNFKYYALEARLTPGRYPILDNNKVLKIENYDRIKWMPEISDRAYGCIYYAAPIRVTVAAEYGLCAPITFNGYADLYDLSWG